MKRPLLAVIASIVVSAGFCLAGGIGLAGPAIAQPRPPTAPEAPSPHATPAPPTTPAPPKDTAPPATSPLVKTVTIDDLVAVLQDAGYRAEIAQGSTRAYIKTGISGRRASIYLYDCEGKNCESYQFSVLFYKSDTFNMKFANAWNLKKRYAKAYINDKGELLFEWDVSLDGGVAPGYVKASVLKFERFMGIFDNFKP